MRLIGLKEIKRVLPGLDLITGIEKGFEAYSSGKVVVPPVGEMIMDKGEVHIKYGFVRGDEFYVIKIASGFYEDPRPGRMTGDGMMLLFSQKTGKPLCALMDKGHLTNIRTAVAGAIVAKYLAPANVKRIGIVGAGIQGRLQLSYLKGIVNCKKVLVWGTRHEELECYRSDMEREGYFVETTKDPDDILDKCNLIITATPAKSPLLKAENLNKGTHITAMGSDTIHKQELDPLILKEADIVVADSIEQCMERGEIFKAIGAGSLSKEKVVELGQIISGAKRGRINEEQVSVADLTGVAVQDIAIAKSVYRAIVSEEQG